MSTHDEAMRLADALDEGDYISEQEIIRQSAAMLRQQDAEIERLTARGDERGVELVAALAEVERLNKKIASMDAVSLAYEQRELPGPFGDETIIGSPAAYMRDHDLHAKAKP